MREFFFLRIEMHEKKGIPFKMQEKTLGELLQEAFGETWRKMRIPPKARLAPGPAAGLALYSS